MKRTQFFLTLAVPAILVSVVLAQPAPAASAPALQQTDNPNPPDHVVRLIFIHHSTGENWLRDDYGGLGQALANNNYYVSDTNYGWGPNSIGDRTDIPDRLEWFASADTPTYLEAVYNESGRTPFTRACRITPAARTRSSCSSPASPTPPWKATRTTRHPRTAG